MISDPPPNDAPRPRPRPRSAAPAATTRWRVTLPALVLPLIASLFYFVLFPGTLLGNSFYTGVKIFLLVWPPIATAFILGESFRRRSPGRRDWRLSLLIGAGFGLLVAGVMFLLRDHTPLGDVLRASAPRMREKVEGLGMLRHYVFFAFLLSIAHALLEEFFWRWFVFGNLRRLMPLGWAHLAAAAGFASHHIVVTSQFFPVGPAIFFGLCVGIGGAFWSWLYQRHHTLLGPWVSHVLIDLAIFRIGHEILFPGA